MTAHRKYTGESRQRGFTLLETLIALMLTGIIASSVTMVIDGIMDNYKRNTAHMLAVKQVENAIHWISLDARMAQNVDLDDVSDNHFPIDFTWTEWDGTEREVIYTLESTDLRRQDFTNGELTGNTIVGHYIDIDASKTICDFNNGVFGLTLTINVSNIAGSRETRIIEIRPRTM